MNQLYLRKLHITIGIISALFILLQSGTGLLLSFSGFSVPHSHAHTDSVTPDNGHEKEPATAKHEHADESGSAHDAHEDKTVATQRTHEGGESLWHRSLGGAHHGGGTIGSTYRILLGVDLIFMAFSGCTIFFITRKMMKK
jgi:hypothetical protein